ILGERALLDRDRVLLGVEADPERKLVGQTAVERDLAVIVRAEEVDGAGEHDPAAEHEDQREGGDRPAQDPPASAGGRHWTAAAEAIGRLTHPLSREPRLLGSAR